MFMNPSFWIFPAFKKSQLMTTRMGAGLQNKPVKTFLASLAQVEGTDSVTSAVLKEVRGAIKEGRDGGQNSGDAGGSHAAEVTIPPFAMKAAAPAPAAKKEYTATEKNSCSIEAMRNGGECEVCQ
jgi:ribonucleoside-diphosphate reductase alpha chain